MRERLRKLWSFNTLLQLAQVSCLVAILLVGSDVWQPIKDPNDIWVAVLILFFFKFMDLADNARDLDRRSDNFNLHIRLKDVERDLDPDLYDLYASEDD